MSGVPAGEVVRPVVEACLRLGVTPAELSGRDAHAHRQAVEVEAGGGLVDGELWRLVLDELDRAMLLALRGAGVRVPSRCRSCDAPVRWVTTVAGKRMALDPIPHPRGNVTRAPGRKDVVDVHPRKAVPLPGVAFRPHWATCPAADTSRRPTRLTPRCAVCKQPLHPALAELGERTHPCCDPTGEMMR